MLDEISLVATTYVAVLLAELIGDRTFFVIGTLATRRRAAAVLCGAMLAFALKALAAIALGQVVAALPPPLVAAVSAATFVGAAVLLWRERDEPPHAVAAVAPRWTAGVSAGFSAVFFAEWADAGQLASAALVARYHAPLAVWLGSVLALTTKATLAVTLGASLRRHVSQSALRRGAIAVCLLLGVLSLVARD